MYLQRGVFLRWHCIAGILTTALVLSSCAPAGIPACAETSGEKSPVVCDTALPGAGDSAAAAVVYSPDIGEIIYGHNVSDRLPVASITKIMTALLCLEYIRTSDPVVTVTEDMLAEGSSMGLCPGDRLRLSQIVKGMMAVSGNDAANAAAVTVAGSQEGFAELMNKRAFELGMKNTHFVTPSGLDSEEHYSSAGDMALLAAAAMVNSGFREIVSGKEVTIEYVYPDNKRSVFRNHNRLLSTCPGCLGIKTGYTKKAGRTLVSYVERNNVSLICVTLNDGDDWKDHTQLYDRCFRELEAIGTGADERITVPLVGGKKNEAVLVPDRQFAGVVRKRNIDKITRTINAPRFLYAPVRKGDIRGEIIYYCDNKPVGKAYLEAGENIETDQGSESNGKGKQ